jgi:hypothetical protein
LRTELNLIPFKDSRAYNLTKYGDAKKVTLAVEAVDQIREAAKIEAEKHVQTEQVQVLTMS